MYTLGTVFYVWRGFPYHHAIWHLFVLAGTVLHFFVVLLYILLFIKSGIYEAGMAPDFSAGMPVLDKVKDDK